MVMNHKAKKKKQQSTVNSNLKIGKIVLKAVCVRHKQSKQKLLRKKKKLETQNKKGCRSVMNIKMKI